MLNHFQKIFCPGLSALILISVLSGCTNPHVDFNAEIRPLLNERCITCHGGIKTKAELNLKFRDLALIGGKSGLPAIVPGDADASELIRMVSHEDASERMPREGAPLTQTEIDRLKDWINQGAEWERHWAYVVPVAESIEMTNGDLSPIDMFVRKKLTDAGLAPSPEASCEILARRVSLDLVGLPATLDQTESYCSTGDFEDLVDELLASASFGERWTALWLDLSRYADSKGYEADRERSIWRYRDWLINAFNNDKPFDQFTIEQIAGDLLPDATDEQKIATAFSRNSMTNDEGGTDDEEHRVAAVMDRVNTTWEVFQGTTMRCVQCHGHPYDPFKQEDYYASFAIFNNTADRDHSDEEPLLREFKPVHQERGVELLGELAAADEAIINFVSTDELLAIRSEWEGNLDDPKVVGGLSTTVQNEVLRIARLPSDERSGQQQVFIRDRFAEIHESTKALRDTRAEVSSALAELKPVTTPVMLALAPGETRITHRFERGNFLSPLEEIQPGIPATFGVLPPDDVADRLAFARWLVSDENPLTARVTVNRFWEQLFGLGIVESADDFGTIGIAPTHSGLLDWLAVEFQHNLDWSVKGILKEIVMSATYRQSSNISPLKLDRDPRNQLLSRGPRFRLSAEQLRDEVLAVSGLLSTKQFGPSVMPPQPDGIWKNPYNGLKWVEAEGEDRYRRAIYTFWRRTGPYPSMITFDAPSREFCISRRIRTNTPLQALVMLNDPAFWEAAEALAVKMENNLPEAATVEQRVALGYRLALSRDPSPEKLAVLTTLAENGSLALVANAIMNLDEFLTKE